jgi:hypothetical protein
MNVVPDDARRNVIRRYTWSPHHDRLPVGASRHVRARCKHSPGSKYPTECPVARRQRRSEAAVVRETPRWFSLELGSQESGPRHCRGDALGNLMDDLDTDTVSPTRNARAACSGTSRVMTPSSVASFTRPAS